MTPMVSTITIRGVCYAPDPNCTAAERNLVKVDENGKLVKVRASEVFALMGKKEEKV